MNIEKSIILMIIGAAVIGMSLSASAEEDVLPREINEEIPVESDDLIIAPNPDATIEHDAEDGQREMEEPIIAPNENVDVLEDDASSEIVDATGSYAALSTESNSAKTVPGLNVLIVIGAVGFLLFAFILLKIKRG